jgi:drug/metabolite transporter (DMT)-like permease
MHMTRWDIVSLIICVLAICVGQGLFKYVGLQLRDGELLFSYRVAVPAIASGIIYVTATVIWIVLLKHIPLSKAYSFMAMSYIVVPLIGMLVFNEQISVKAMLGAVLIVLGILVVATQ